MEVKIRDKVICWVAIILFAFFALVGLLAITPTKYNLPNFNVLGFFPLLLWLIFGCIARHKMIWSFFFGSFSLYVLIFVCNGAKDFYENAPFMVTIVYILIQIYMFFPVLYFAVFFRRAASIFAYTFSPQAKEMKQKKKEDLWKQEMAKAAGTAQENSFSASGAANMKNTVSQVMQNRGTTSTQNPNRLDMPETPVSPAVKPQEPLTAAQVYQPSPVERASSSPALGKIDVNTCAADALLVLPGMSPAAAQQAIASRTEKGPYLSPDDFIERNQIKPHFAVQILGMIETPAAAPVQHEKPQPKRRSLDL